MLVIGLTAFIGLALVTFFAAMFITFGAEGSGREPLLPLSDESARVIRTAKKTRENSEPENHGASPAGKHPL